MIEMYPQTTYILYYHSQGLQYSSVSFFQTGSIDSVAPPLARLADRDSQFVIGSLET